MCGGSGGGVYVCVQSLEGFYYVHDLSEIRSVLLSLKDRKNKMEWTMIISIILVYTFLWVK